MEQHTLKNCPFCGGTNTNIAEDDATETVYLCVKCFHCGARSISRKLKQQAVADWNRRTLPRRSEAVLLDLANGVISVGDAMELLEGMR